MFEHSLGEFLGGRRACIDAHVRVSIDGLSQRVQPLHLRAVGGQRPAAVGGDPLQDGGEGHVEPDRQRRRG